MSFLACDEKARNSDDYLYSAICQTKLLEKGIDADKITFVDVMAIRNELGLPPLETVRRTRQRIQQLNPDQRGNDEVEAMRSVNEEIVKEYVRGVMV